MKRKIFGIAFMFLFVTAGAQKMADLFIKMPDGLIVHLEEAWRKDLVDLYKAGKPAQLDNTMQGKSTLLKLTDQYLKLQSTERSVVELRLLPLVNNTFIICMVITVYGPVADSRVSFYSTEWQPLTTDEIFTPITADWFRKADLDPQSIAELARLDICLIKYSLSDEDATLTAEYTSPQYLDNDNQQVMKKLLKTEHKKFEWKSGRFE